MNYRPVSHIIQIGKIVELAVQSQIVAHFENNNLFHPHQYGSVANHSKTTAVIHVHERWLEALEKDHLSASCLLDQTAAYDLLCHKTLDEKLILFNFDEVSRSWIRSYLSDRTQRVQVETKISSGIKGEALLYHKEAY